MYLDTFPNSLGLGADSASANQDRITMDEFSGQQERYRVSRSLKLR